MAEPPETLAEQVARGRAAARRRAWDEAYAAFAAANAITGREPADPSADPEHQPVDPAARPALEPADLETWATAAYLLGHVATAVDALVRAFGLHRAADDVAAAVRCAFWIVFILLNSGDMAQAAGWQARCAHLLEGLPPDRPGHGYLQCITAFRLAALERRYADAQAAADAVAGTARQTQDADLLALALNVAGRAAILDGRAADGFARLDEAMVAVISGELSPPVAGSVYCSVIEASEQVADLRRSAEWTDALARWCARQEGMITFTGQCLTHRAGILRRRGDWQAAAEQAFLACERFVGAADEVAVGAALYELGEVRRMQGDLDGAEEAYRRAGAAGHDPQPGLALTRLAQGRSAHAAAAMRRVLAERSDAVERVRLLPASVEVMLAVGDRPAAAAAADELARHAAAYGTEALQAQTDHARGAVLLAGGAAAAAATHLRRACGIWQSLDAPYEIARTRVLLSRAYAALGDADAAGLEREAARTTFTRLGAATDLARLTTSDRRPGHGGHRLTQRELEVLRLVATGRTNQAIADELYLAVRTVDRHVGSILAKLGVASRTAATAFAYEHDLL